MTSVICSRQGVVFCNDKGLQHVQEMVMASDLFIKRLNEMKRLLSASGLNPMPDDEDIQIFSAKLEGSSPWESFRINPIAFADETSLDVRIAIRLFVYAAKAGLVNFEWNLLCPYCGGREHSHDSLDQLEKDSYHCTVCDIGVDVEADRHLEVSFSLSADLRHGDLNPYGTLEEYQRYYFSSNFVHTPAYQKVLREQPRIRFAALAPGKRGLVRIGDTPSKKHRVFTLDTHSVFTAFLSKETCSDVRHLSVSHNAEGFSKKKETIDCGPAEIEVKNSWDRQIGIIVASPDSPALTDAIMKEPPYFKPFVTGRMMLNNQSFRELFLVDNLPNDLSLKVSDITLMFTDLKGSTEMYSRTGDVRAYRLVQRHFEILQNLVGRNDGAVVKTMGDAVMASFCTPADGVRAASEMIHEINDFNASLAGDGTVGLKIGLHRGPVIAVKANQTLDYFGQTVNIAARVQALAGSGEIYMTSDVHSDNDVAGLISQYDFDVEESDASLKGVEGLTKVFCCH
jgi:class 3 adenylate cyclase